MEEKRKWGLNWDIWTRDKFQCRYCGFDGLANLLSAHQMVVDHVRPKCRDGKDDSDNLVTACNCCNFIKAEWDRSQYNPEVFEGKPASEVFQAAKDHVDRWYATWNHGYELMMDEARKH